MATLGQELKRERELRAISLNDIAGQTRIGLRYLQALEDDCLELLPGAFFIKSVLRAYSKCIGVDENRFVNKYHEEVLLQQEDLKETERRRRNDNRSEPRARREEAKRGRWRLAAVPLVLIAAAVAAYVFILKPQKDNGPVIQRPAVAPSQEQTLPSPTQAPLAAPDDPANAGELRLELTFNAETWIQVAADGQVQLEAIKKAGEKATYTAKKQFLIQTGNAGGFTYTINGREGKPLGASGAVRTDIWIHRDNLKDFLAAR
jgi:cytoskeletal protein RodZ